MKLACIHSCKKKSSNLHPFIQRASFSTTLYLREADEALLRKKQATKSRRVIPKVKIIIASKEDEGVEPTIEVVHQLSTNGAFVDLDEMEIKSILELKHLILKSDDGSASKRRTKGRISKGRPVLKLPAVDTEMLERTPHGPWIPGQVIPSPKIKQKPRPFPYGWSQEVEKSTQPHTILVDGSQIIFRSFYGLHFLENGGLYGYVKTILKALREMKPFDYFGVIFDPKGRKTMKDEMGTDYKKNRVKHSEELAKQWQLLPAANEAINVTQFVKPGYEADDVIATYTKQALTYGHKVTIVSTDKDMHQLVGPHVRLFDFTRKVYIGENDVKAKWGIPPYLMPHLQAIVGDKCDNVTGIRGLGPHLAARLLNKYGGLDGILNNETKFQRHKEAILHNLAMVTLKNDIEVDPLEIFKSRPIEKEKLFTFLRGHQILSIIAQFNEQEERDNELNARRAKRAQKLQQLKELRLLKEKELQKKREERKKMILARRAEKLRIKQENEAKRKEQKRLSMEKKAMLEDKKKQRLQMLEANRKKKQQELLEKQRMKEIRLKERKAKAAARKALKKTRSPRKKVKVQINATKKVETV